MPREAAIYGLAIGVVLILQGCAPGPTGVTANSELVVESTSAALTGSYLEWANGTYSSNCTSYYAISPNWSVRISGAAAMDNQALAVVMDNSLCTLTLTALVTSESGKTTYTASPSITLGASYAGSASTFSSGSGTAFYGNAMLSATGFASNFTVDILYSDNPNNSTQQNLTGAWASVTASSATTVNSAPNYSFSFGSLAICTDNAFTVEGSCSSGSATVSPAGTGPVYGDHYCVDSSLTTASPTFTQVDTAYAGTSCTTTKTTISGNSAFNVAESSFSLTSLSTSPVYRTVIVHNSTSGVNSYQTFFIAFTQP